MAERDIMEITEIIFAVGQVTIRPSHAGTQAPENERWYASVGGIEMESGSFLVSHNTSGPTPEQAVRNLWEKLQGGVIRLKGGRRVEWNGFMWKDRETVEELRRERALHA